ncbi:hypothetical protein [Paenibacillus campinasensis]|nr:hypothetical protein [Paenibacillus campinasensis]
MSNRVSLAPFGRASALASWTSRHAQLIASCPNKAISVAALL